MVVTVFIISYGYSRIIEQFPSGGGGYLVVSKILGGPVGVTAGSALLVDYVLIITISIITHAFLFVVAIGGHVPELFRVIEEVRTNVGHMVSAFGVFVTLKLLMHVYSFGGGIYTGIEVVSNGFGIMREPRMQTT